MIVLLAASKGTAETLRGLLPSGSPGDEVRIPTTPAQLLEFLGPPAPQLIVAALDELPSPPGASPEEAAYHWVLRLRAKAPQAVILAKSRLDSGAWHRSGVDSLVSVRLTGQADEAEISEQISKAWDRILRNARTQTRSGIRVGARGVQEILGVSPATQRLRQQLATAAQVKAPVLLTGESGAGKELAAFTVHRLSPWSQGPFVPFNPAAVGEGLIESELFGHKKGAFTGANTDRAGVVESAAGGTLFLDEIGELPQAFQVKLLRFLDSARYHRLGDDQPRKLKARLVFATNRNLEAEVRAGNFREDLFHRLNVLRVRLPPLRERREDIAILAESFLSRLSQGLGRRPPKLSPLALAALEAHPFPGNVRELRNLLERATILSPTDRIEVEDLELQSSPGIAPPQAIPLETLSPPPLPPRSQGTPSPLSGESFSEELARATALLRYRPGAQLKDTLEALERVFLLQALAHHEGNVTVTAKSLGIARRTLQDKMLRHDLRSED